MPKHSLDKEVRKNILKARKWIEDIAQKDANEAETRTRIHDIFGMLMGYDRFEHIKQEDPIRGAGEPMRCDLAIQINHEESAKPDFLIEVKRVNVDITLKHIGQAARYAIDLGCEWVLLTNGREWKLYHVSFSKPPQTTLIESWNFTTDTPVTLDKKFGIISYRNIKKGSLPRLWEKRNVLTTMNLLKIFLSEQSIRSIRSKFKRENQVIVSPEEIVGAVRRMLNPDAVGEMDKVRISLPAKQAKRAKTVISKPISVEKEAEAILVEKQSNNPKS
jgi:predicted type IV restriction endonuclease